MSEIRVTDFNPEKLTPNFHAFLQQAGDVSYGSEIQPVQRHGIDTSGKIKEGSAKDVRLNGEVIGQIECYIDPPAVCFDGYLPTSLIPPSQRKPIYALRKSRTNTPDTSNTRQVSLTYHWEHPLANKIGRGDGWEIPLP